MPIHRALLLVGSGANGKGTFLHVVRELLGSENTSSIELQTLAKDENHRDRFYGSMANIDDDLSKRKLERGLGMFKKLIAGDPVTAAKKYNDPYQFVPNGKHLYAANEVPDIDVPDDDDAFWRRWLLVEFPNHYPPSHRDPTLRDKLSSPGSLSGVLNWAIEGRRRLLDQGHFTNEHHHAFEKRKRWQEWGGSIDEFISECIKRDEDAPNVSTGQVKTVFDAWCRENDKDNDVSQTQVTNTLKNEGLGYRESVRPDGTGSPTRGFKALGFTEDAPSDAIPTTKQDSLQ